MPVQTLDDVLRFNAYIRRKLVRRVQELSEEARNWKPAPGRWSALEHLEHVALAERYLTAWLQGLVHEGHQRGLRAPRDLPRQVDAAIPLRASGADRTPKQSPPEGWPAGRTLPDILHMFQENQPIVEQLANELYDLDTDRLTFYHALADTTLNAAQLLHFMGIHEWLHDQHIQANAAAWQAANG